MKRKMNIEVFFQLIILLGCAVLLVIALISGNIKSYVHPRFVVYLWISAGALIIIGLFLLPNLFKPKHSVHLIPYVILMIPMLTAFTLPAKAVNNQTASFGNKTAAQMDTIFDHETTSQFVTDTAVTTKTALTEPEVTEKITESPAITKESSGITFSGNMQIISDSGYINWYVDCYDNPQNYDGKTVQFKAKVFYFDGSAENEFVPGRLCMLCCAADAVPWGFLCRTDELKNYKENDWVIVTAIIKVENYQGEAMPILYASGLAPATPPDDEYIYFNY